MNLPERNKKSATDCIDQGLMDHIMLAEKYISDQKSTAIQYSVHWHQQSYQTHDLMPIPSSYPLRSLAFFPMRSWLTMTCEKTQQDFHFRESHPLRDAGNELGRGIPKQLQNRQVVQVQVVQNKVNAYAFVSVELLETMTRGLVSWIISVVQEVIFSSALDILGVL